MFSPITNLMTLDIQSPENEEAAHSRLSSTSNGVESSHLNFTSIPSNPLPVPLKKFKTDLEFKESNAICIFCGKSYSKEKNPVINILTLKPRFLRYVQKILDSRDGKHALDRTAHICPTHLQKILESRMDELLEEDLEQLYKLQEEGFKNLTQYELEEDKWQTKFDRERTLGERAADNTAKYGGSWGFVIGLLSFLIIWAILNAVVMPYAAGQSGWDPYPFILMNLFLSMLAAFQAVS